MGRGSCSMWVCGARGGAVPGGVHESLRQERLIAVYLKHSRCQRSHWV